MAVRRHLYDESGQRRYRTEVGVELGPNNVFQSYLRTLAPANMALRQVVRGRPKDLCGTEKWKAKNASHFPAHSLLRRRTHICFSRRAILKNHSDTNYGQATEGRPSNRTF